MTSLFRNKAKKTRGRVPGVPTAHRGRTAQQAAISKVPLFPARRPTKDMLYYDYSIALSGTAGVPDHHFFSANDLFDPNVTGTGHQPIGYDQMMIFYEHFAVVSSKITITFMNDGAVPVRLGVALSPDAVALSSPIQIMENGLIESRAIDCKASPGTGQRITNVSLDCDVASYFGKRSHNDILDDEKLTGSVTTSPTEGVYFDIMGWDPFTASNWQATCDILISYNVVFFEPRKASVSEPTVMYLPTEHKSDSRVAMPSSDIPEQSYVTISAKVPSSKSKRAGRLPPPA